MDGHRFAMFVSRLKHDVANCKSKYRARITGTNEMLEALSIGFSAARYDTIAYHLNGRAAGALVLEKAQRKVLAMVTHPDSKGVGSALMERAVNLAKERTGRAQLQLETMDESAAAAYRKMGFVMERDDASDYDLGAGSDSDSDITCESMVLDASHDRTWRTDIDGQLRMNNRRAPVFIA